jgi:hypothetical protein
MNTEFVEAAFQSAELSPAKMIATCWKAALPPPTIAGAMASSPAVRDSRIAVREEGG